MADHHLRAWDLGSLTAHCIFEENLGMPEGELKEDITGAWVVET